MEMQSKDSSGWVEWSAVVLLTTNGTMSGYWFCFEISFNLFFTRGRYNPSVCSKVFWENNKTSGRAKSREVFADQNCPERNGIEAFKCNCEMLDDVAGFFMVASNQSSSRPGCWSGEIVGYGKAWSKEWISYLQRLTFPVQSSTSENLHSALSWANYCLYNYLTPWFDSECRAMDRTVRQAKHHLNMIRLDKARSEWFLMLRNKCFFFQNKENAPGVIG